MPEVALAQGFGRIGCFLAGCCYGRETTAAWGITFPADSMAPSGIKLIPTQLLSAAGDFFDCRNPDMDCTPFFISAEKADNRRYRQYLFTAVWYRKISD
ncbi:MAG: prolipoprotein diacylglyceryl transferase family protein [Lachnospira sp.]